jgi:glycosyltransferase involved in cell wall biosynthesis
MATVSTIIPGYNAEPYLAEAIQSVLNQTRPSDEIIVVDDCSTDRTAEIAHEYGVRVLRTPANQGPAAARNLGMRATSADLVAWLDADDYWEPEHLEIVVGLLERFDEAAVAFSLVRHVGSRSGIWSPKHFIPADVPTDAFWQCLSNNIVPQMSAVVRRIAALDVGGYDDSMRRSQDFDLWLRMSLIHKFVRASVVTANYRWHEVQTSSRARGAQIAADHDSRSRLLERLRADNNTELARSVAARMSELWEESLRDAWGWGDKKGLAYLIACADRVPTAPARRVLWTIKVWTYLRLFMLWGAAKSIVAAPGRLFRSRGAVQADGSRASDQ